MNRVNKKRKNSFINILLIVLIVIAVCTLGFSAYKLISINNSYEEASNLYADIEAIVAAPAQTVANDITTVSSSDVQLKPEEEEAQEVKYDAEGLRYIPGTAFNDFHPALLSWNYDALLKLCEDSVGYIYQKDVMSYPIVQAEDNEKYLRHLINGEYNVAGTLFVDYRCPEGLEGRYSLVYGHNMDDGSMFGSITAYADEEYYKDHPYFEVFVGPDQYLYYVYAAARIEEDSDIFTFDMNDEEFMQVLSDIRALTPYEMIPVQVTPDSHVIVLSTCIDYPRNYDFRYVVVLVRERQLLDASYDGKLPWIEKQPAEDQDADSTQAQDAAQDAEQPEQG